MYKQLFIDFMLAASRERVDSVPPACRSTADDSVRRTLGSRDPAQRGFTVERSSQICQTTAEEWSY